MTGFLKLFLLIAWADFADVGVLAGAKSLSMGTCGGRCSTEVGRRCKCSNIWGEQCFDHYSVNWHLVTLVSEGRRTSLTWRSKVGVSMKPGTLRSTSLATISFMRVDTHTCWLRVGLTSTCRTRLVPHSPTLFSSPFSLQRPWCRMWQQCQHFPPCEQLHITNFMSYLWCIVPAW